MINRLLHGIGWKVDGKWNKEEVLLDYSIFSTVFLIVSLILF